eukprot:m.377210 g.377210  ORF g.377210 m.377210 type:complete len:60 (-) comp20923_c0_seq87:2173-2352(-)
MRSIAPIIHKEQITTTMCRQSGLTVQEEPRDLPNKNEGGDLKIKLHENNKLLESQPRFD